MPLEKIPNSNNKKPTNWWGRHNAATLKFHSKQQEAAFSTVFRDNFRPEVVGDVISGVTEEQVDMNVVVKFGDTNQTVLEIFEQLTL